jgi:hypothetical protein
LKISIFVLGPPQFFWHGGCIGGGGGDSSSTLSPPPSAIPSSVSFAAAAAGAGQTDAEMGRGVARFPSGFILGRYRHGALSEVTPTSIYSFIHLVSPSFIHFPFPATCDSTGVAEIVVSDCGVQSKKVGAVFDKYSINICLAAVFTRALSH